MPNAAQKLMTVEEFFDWCKDQEERYELVDGVPLRVWAGFGPGPRHDLLTSNVSCGLAKTVDGGARCVASTAWVRTRGLRVRRPDVTIECAPPSATSYEATNPVAVFEVLSPTTRKNDRNAKLPEYLQHPSLRTIVLIDPDIMDVLVYRREPGGVWHDERLMEADQTIAIEGTGATLALADIYAGVDFGQA